jgi:hypothetical protein
MRPVQPTMQPGDVAVMHRASDLSGKFPPAARFAFSPPIWTVRTFGELYHKRWRIEEAYKRLKHRMHLECVSGLSQQALIIDVAAKVLADNIATVLCATAAEDADLAARSRRCNRSYAATLLQRVLPRLVLQLEDWVKTLTATLELLGATTQRFIAGRSRPRPANHVKPHPSMCYKG